MPGEIKDFVPPIFVYIDEDRAKLLGNSDFKVKKKIAERILDPFTQHRSTVEILRLQCQLIKEIIGDEILLAKREVIEHKKQDNSDYLVTCTVASGINIADALTSSGYAFDQEEDFLRLVPNANSVDDIYDLADSRGYLKPSHIENTLKRSGYSTVAVGTSITELSLGLISGMMALFIQDEHCRMISGIRKIGKDIEYAIHDPFYTTVSYITIDQLFNLISKNPTGAYISLIDDPKPTEAPIVITDPGE